MYSKSLEGLQASVVMVSAPERERVCEQTQHHMVAMGFRRILTARNKPDEQVCHHSHGILARRVMRSALRDYPDRPVLFVEDDIRFHDDLTGLILPPLALLVESLNIPVTLYLPNPESTENNIPGEDFYPFDYTKDRFWIFPVARQDRWWGSQALLLPTLFCHELLDSPLEEPLDRLIRRVLEERPIYGVSPNIVNHLGLPSVSECPAPTHRSLTFHHQLAS